MIITYPNMPMIENSKESSVFLLGSYSKNGLTPWKIQAARKIENHFGNIIYSDVVVEKLTAQQRSHIYCWIRSWLLHSTIVGFWIDDVSKHFNDFELGFAIGRLRSIVLGISEHRPGFDYVTESIESMLAAYGLPITCYTDMDTWAAAIVGKGKY